MLGEREVPALEFRVHQEKPSEWCIAWPGRGNNLRTNDVSGAGREVSDVDSEAPTQQSSGIFVGFTTVAESPV